jgi:hypothetical protein
MRLAKLVVKLIQPKVSGYWNVAERFPFVTRENEASLR